MDEHSPALADLYFAYGKALLENAIVQNSVLGKNQPEGEADEAEGEGEPLIFPAYICTHLMQNLATGSDVDKLGAFLSFSGDAEDEAVDMFAEAEKAVEEEDDDDPEAEPEDDFNAAWEVLDLARAIFENQKDVSDEAKLKLADTYMSLGDVSLETGSSIFSTCGPATQP